MSRRGEVLVAIVNNYQDWATLTVSAKQHARDQHWYCIPVESVERLLKRYWAPKWLAFYQTKVFVKRLMRFAITRRSLIFTNYLVRNFEF
ncbi:MAG: hypothetical protein SFY66_14395 [Oculatellaceae cyanobacterium bins.114]|nr:hypothetical protein [Oculatellaceae cyanobacterium bins.114]